jgi:parallel beta-helix repeat protein
MKRLIICTLFLFPLPFLSAQEIKLTKGIKITKSSRIKSGVYKIEANTDLWQPVIVIEGHNIIIDFNNSTLRGSNRNKNPDEFFGTALLIRNSKHVTVKNLKAHGYKVALMGFNVEFLTLENCDFSYNYRPQLNSTQEKEDISDWMSYHHNENDQWLRYGAAIYLRNCDFAVIRNCRVTGGQNALMMTACNDAMIYNNDFSFNSGIGIGFYRCNRNNVMYNRVIFNVRGYSHGVYNRGQDSAGILVYEQSSNNFFFRNNVTHGGDGFFLWAGQTTMDSGQGGCNDNILLGNDFSYAPTNGIEVTFSRNKIINNRMYECDHGIWGGYSYNSIISGNHFRNNRIGIAIEHGQDNEIRHNVFFRDKEAIRLWARKEQPADWGYAKHRDTRSRDYIITNNNFSGNEQVLNVTRTENLLVTDNIYTGYERLFKLDSTVTGFDTTWHIDFTRDYDADTAFTMPVIASPEDPFKGTAQWAGRKNILVTEWGPHDFRSPLIWNSNPTDTSLTMTFNLLGPKGKWKVKRYRGVQNISIKNGEFPASITADKIPAERTDISIELEYRGEEITTPFGEKIPAGRKYRFFYKKYFQPIDWQVYWFAIDTSGFNPLITGQLFPPNVKVRPIKSEKTNKLDYAWWGGIKDEEGNLFKQFATTAEGQAQFLPGEYELGVTWDDAVRVYVDGKMVIDEWNPSLYTFDESPHKKVRLKLNGTHFFRVEHLELGGFATLSLKIKKLP